MTRALLWKELREQRQLVLTAWLIVVVLPLFLAAGMMATPEYELDALGRMLPSVLMALVWPVFGAATGAATVAADRSDGSLRFLFSRPVSRSRIWFTKVIAAAAALGLIVVGSLAIAAAFDYFLTGRYRLLAGEDAGAAAGFGALAVALLIGAHYCSLFFRRTLAAALASTVVVASLTVFVYFVWMMLVQAPSRGALEFLEVGASVGPPLAMFGLLTAAWWVFSRSDLFTGNPAWRMAGPLAVVGLCVALLGAIPGAWAGARVMTERSVGTPPGFRLVDGAALVVQPTATGFSTRVALIDAGAGETRLIGARNGVGPVMSADGSLIVYARMPGMLYYLTSGTGEVRVVGRDGSGDRHVMPVGASWVMNVNPLLSISPDNRFVAVAGGRVGVYIARLDGGTPVAGLVRFTEPARGRNSYELLGWTGGAPAELLYARISRSSGPDALTQIIAADARDGSERIVATFPGRYHEMPRANGWHTTAERAWRWYPLWITQATTGERRLVLIDTESGEVIELSDTPCPAWGFDAGGSRFIYGHCAGGRFDLTMELRVRDLATGTDERFAVLDGMSPASRGTELFLSADGRRAVAYLVGTRGSYPGAMLIEPAGRAADDDAVAPTPVSDTAAAREDARVERLTTGRSPIGWLDADHVVVAADGVGGSNHVELQVINVETRAVRQVYHR